MSTFTLKLIALITMILDHTGILLSSFYNNDAVVLFRIVGRISFPIYVFLIAEGCRRTKDIKKFFLRLFLFALASEIPFDFLFENIKANNSGNVIFLNLAHQNVFFTLSFGVLCVYLINNLKIVNNYEEKYIPFIKNSYIYNGCIFLCIVVIVSLGTILKTDYNSFGIMAIIGTYYISYFEPEGKLSRLCLVKKIILLGVMFSFLYIDVGYKYVISVWVAMLCLCFYNGKKGANFKWLFYIVYPAHLIILALINLKFHP